MNSSFQETKNQISFIMGHPSVSLARSDHDLAIREADSPSLSRPHRLFNLSCTLPSNLIPSCKTKWVLGLLDDMGTLPHV